MPELTSESKLPITRREIPAWVTSVGLHLLVLVVLAQVTRYTVTHRETMISSALSEVEPIDPQEFQFDATLEDQVGGETHANSLTPTLAAATVVPTQPQPEELPQPDVEQQILDVTPPPVFDAFEMQDEVILEQIDTKGATEHAGGVEGAIDRLTYEIAGSLKERKTLVVWLLDASLSLKERRDAIADRFENVYRQLGQLNVGDDGALKTGVVSFGQSIHYITPEPVSDYKKISDAIRNVAPDESGVENVFSAVGHLTEKWRMYPVKQHYNTMFIIVTDERGDDVGRLEEVISAVRRFGIRVYCVANAAVFGREHFYVQWRYSDGFTEYIPTDRGPETVRPERLKLAFWGTAAGHLESLSAGVGPYALTRLCHESDGLFLVTEDSGMKFDPEIMRNYRPDYVTVRDYDQSLAQNRAKEALVRAAVETSATEIPRPQLRFRADSDNVLRQETTEAQKPLAVLNHRLEQMQSILEIGERDRDKLEDPRWRAGFDLAMGRTLAMRVRAFGYQVMLAEMKTAPRSFQTQGNNTWRLVPSQEIPPNPSVKQWAEKSIAYLKRVIEEHAGTPWAEIAKVELSQPLGWQWREMHVEYPKMEVGPNGNPLQLAEERRRMQAGNRPQSQPRVKPKL